MGNEKTDVVIIGGGAGGIPAAIRARQLGASTVLIEKEFLGGVCMNRGCIPTKSLIETARLYHSLKRANDFGLKVPQVEVDWAALMAKKEDTVNYMRMGNESLLKAKGVEIVRGEACFTGPNRIRVADQEIEAKAVIIGTGSRPSPPAIEGVELEGVLGSDDVISMQELPSSVAVLGSGPVEMELAQYLCLLGARVSLIEEEKRLLPDEEYRELSGRLTKIFRD